MRIFVADADQDALSSLHLRLNLEPSMSVVGLSVQADSLLQQLPASNAEVLLLEWCLPGRPIQEVISTVKRLSKPPQIIVLANQPEEECAARAAGADDYFAKIWPSTRLITILRALSR